MQTCFSGDIVVQDIYICMYLIVHVRKKSACICIFYTLYLIVALAGRRGGSMRVLSPAVSRGPFTYESEIDRQKTENIGMSESGKECRSILRCFTRGARYFLPFST